MPTLSFVLFALSSLFAVIDPLGCIPFFSGLTARMTDRQKRRTLARSLTIAFCVLMAFTWGGTALLKLFGITINAFRIAGGVIFFGIGLDMLRSEPRRWRTGINRAYADDLVARDEDDPDGDDPSITPLAIPLLAGPGSITTVMVLRADGGASPLGGALVSAAVLRHPGADGGDRALRRPRAASPRRERDEGGREAHGPRAHRHRHPAHHRRRGAGGAQHARHRGLGAGRPVPWPPPAGSSVKPRLHAPTPGLRQPSRQRGVRQDRRQSGRQRARIAGRDEQAIHPVTDDLAAAARDGRHHGHAADHRFQGDQAERFGGRGDGLDIEGAAEPRCLDLVAMEFHDVRESPGRTRQHAAGGRR